MTDGSDLRFNAEALKWMCILSGVSLVFYRLTVNSRIVRRPNPVAPPASPQTRTLWADEIRRLIAERFNLPPASLASRVRLQDDLRIPRGELLAFIGELEDHFNAQPPEAARLRQVSTVEDLIALFVPKRP